MRVRLPLFRGQQRQQRRECVHRERGRAGEHQVLAVHVEGVANLMTADHRTLAGDHVHAQVIQLEHIVRLIYRSAAYRTYYTSACLSSRSCSQC